MAQHIPKVHLHLIDIVPVEQVVMDVDADGIPIGRIGALEFLGSTILGYAVLEDIEPAVQAFGAEILSKLPAEAFRKLGWLARNGELPKKFPRDVIAVLDGSEPDELLEAMRAAGFVSLATESEPSNRWRLKDPNLPKATKKRHKK